MEINCQNCQNPIHGFGFVHLPSNSTAVCSDCWDELEDKAEMKETKNLVNTESADAHRANE